ncbi:MAG: hypothetical protein JXQ73_17795 [Phycisphaerae bacterium]|nr:hypothetical protein [Phycisphaerae bacterium]
MNTSAIQDQVAIAVLAKSMAIEKMEANLMLQNLAQAAQMQPGQRPPDLVPAAPTSLDVRA